MATSTASRIAQTTGLLGAAWFSGNIAALSLIATPALTTPQSRETIPSSTLARQWYILFSKGKAQNPPIAIVAAASFSYLAWTLRSLPGNQAKFYGAAAVFTVAIVPYTIFAMLPTNEKLTKKAEGSVDVKGEEEKVALLLKRWTFLNGVRSVLPLVGGALGVFAAFS